MMGALARNRAAAIDTSTGIATAWDPSPNSIINALKLSGTTLYMGGSFTTIGGQSRNNIAEIDTSTGTATSMNLNASSSVYALETFGSTVHIGGNFSGIGGNFFRNRYASIILCTP